MNFDWESLKVPALVVLGLLLLGLILFLILRDNRKKREPTPMQLLVKNIRASARRVPSREVWLSGNKHVPAMRVGRLLGVLYTPHAVALVTKWSIFSFREEVLLAAPSDVEDYRGDRTIVHGTGAMRYVNDLFWLQPDLQDKKTRLRWAKTLGYPAEFYEDAWTAENLLEPIAAYYRAAVVAWLAPQEELAAIDLNSQVRRAIPFGEKQVRFRDEKEPEREEESDTEDEDAQTKGAAQ